MFAGLTPPYDVIVADCPWRFRTWNGKPGTRGAENHYRTMTLPEIKAMPVKDLAARDTHLFFWTTAPFLAESIEILKAWGFRYSSVAFVWVKLRRNAAPLFYGDRDFFMSTGYTTRKGTELCLLGRRGSPKRYSERVSELIVDPVREHSRKPGTMRLRIEEYVGPGKRIVELFSRETIPGWDAWGDEAGKFDLEAAE